MPKTPNDALQAAVRLRATLSAVMRPLRARLPRDATTAGSAQLATLSHLYRVGPLTPSQLARHEGVKLQTLTRLLAELEAAGLVTRAPHAQDGRQSLLTITRDGALLLTAEAKRRETALAAALSQHLNAAERQQLLNACALLDRLADGLARDAHEADRQAARA